MWRLLLAVLVLTLVAYVFSRLWFVRDSRRLGNIIDSWFYSSTGSTRSVKELYGLTKRLRGCFGSYLRDNPTSHVISDPARAQLLRSKSDEWWASYDYANIELSCPEFQKSLRDAIDGYLLKTKKALPQYPAGVCVIHYRLGDFIALGQCISPESVVAACKTLSTRPSSFYILDGGSTHGGEAELEDASPSLNLVGELSALLQTEFPGTRIEIAPKGSTDDDFFQVTASPLLVTTGGSFGILGALSSYARSIRTPACKNLNFPQKGRDDPRSIAAGDCPDWRTYDYEMLQTA